MKITDGRKKLKRFNELKKCDVFLLALSDASAEVVCMKAISMSGEPKCVNLETGTIGTVDNDRYVEPLDAELIIRG